MHAHMLTMVDGAKLGKQGAVPPSVSLVTEMRSKMEGPLAVCQADRVGRSWLVGYVPPSLLSKQVLLEGRRFSHHPQTREWQRLREESFHPAHCPVNGTKGSISIIIQAIDVTLFILIGQLLAGQQ